MQEMIDLERYLFLVHFSMVVTSRGTFCLHRYLGPEDDEILTGSLRYGTERIRLRPRVFPNPAIPRKITSSNHSNPSNGPHAGSSVDRTKERHNLLKEKKKL